GSGMLAKRAASRLRLTSTTFLPWSSTASVPRLPSVRDALSVPIAARGRGGNESSPATSTPAEVAMDSMMRGRLNADPAAPDVGVELRRGQRQLLQLRARQAVQRSGLPIPGGAAVISNTAETEPIIGPLNNLAYRTMAEMGGESVWDAHPDFHRHPIIDDLDAQFQRQNLARRSFPVDHTFRAKLRRRGLLEGGADRSDDKTFHWMGRITLRVRDPQPVGAGAAGTLRSSTGGTEQTQSTRGDQRTDQSTHTGGGQAQGGYAAGDNGGPNVSAGASYGYQNQSTGQHTTQNQNTVTGGQTNDVNVGSTQQQFQAELLADISLSLTCPDDS